MADAALVDRDVVAIGAGAHGVNLHLDPADLVRVLGAEVADVTRSATERLISSTSIAPSSASVTRMPSHSANGAGSRPVRPIIARSTNGVCETASPMPPSGTASSKVRTPAAIPSGLPPVASLPARPSITPCEGSWLPDPRTIHAAVSAARSAGETKTAS